MSEHRRKQWGEALKSTRRIVGFAAVALLTVSGIGCSSSDDGGEGADATTSSSVDVAAFSSWDGTGLLRATGPVTVADEIGVYYGNDGTALEVVAVDLIDGGELWTRPAHQHARPTGVVDSPAVDADRGLVFITALTEDVPQLVALDIETGRVAWAVRTVWAQGAPSLCGDGSVCMSPADPEEPTLLHDRDSGEVVQEITDAGLEVVVAQDEGAVLSADPVGGSVELGTISESGYQQEWRHSLSAFVPEDVAPSYGPYGGWRGQIAESGIVVFGFAAFAGVDATQDAWEEALRLGDMVGVVGDDGDVLLGIHGVDLVYDLAWTDEGFTVASGLEFKREQDFDDDGQLDLEPTFSRLSFYPLPGLDPVESPTLEALESFGGMVTETSDPNLVLLRYATGPLVFDRSDASVDDASGDLIVGCDIDGVDVAEDIEVELATFDGETETYRAAYDFLGMCDLSGAQIDPEETVESGTALPRWFGVAHLVDHEDEETADGIAAPAVWMDNDRVLHGAFNPAAR